MRRGIVAAAMAFAAVPIACSAVLGLDAPTLDPCAQVACTDGAAPDGDAAPSSDAGARPDQGPIVGLRCGGGSFGVSGCMGATPLCCQTTDDAGTAYACRANAAACSGYSIACTTNNDCAGNDVCCHSATQMKCVTSTSCANDSLACEPDGAADQCPTGWTCSAPFTNDGVVSPYFGCAP